MDFNQILTEILSLEHWAARLPQRVADNNESAVIMAKLVASRYNEMFNLYPVTIRHEKVIPQNMNPRLIRK